MMAACVYLYNIPNTTLSFDIEAYFEYVFPKCNPSASPPTNIGSSNLVSSIGHSHSLRDVKPYWSVVRFYPPKNNTLEQTIHALESFAKYYNGGSSIMARNAYFYGLAPYLEPGEDAQIDVDVVFIYSSDDHLATASVGSSSRTKSVLPSLMVRDALCDSSQKQKYNMRLLNFCHCVKFDDVNDGALSKTISEGAEALMSQLSNSRPKNCKRPVIFLSQDFGALIACKAMTFVVTTHGRIQDHSNVYQDFVVGSTCLIRGNVLFPTTWNANNSSKVLDKFSTFLGFQEHCFAGVKKEEEKPIMDVLEECEDNTSTQNIPLLMFYEVRARKIWGIPVPTSGKDPANSIIKHFPIREFTKIPIDKDYKDLNKISYGAVPEFVTQAQSYIKQVIGDWLTFANSPALLASTTISTIGEKTKLSIDESKSEKEIKIETQPDVEEDDLEDDDPELPAYNPPMYAETVESHSYEHNEAITSHLIKKFKLIDSCGRFDEVGLALPTTCENIMQHEQYENWRDEPNSSILIIRGATGTGKSVLARHLIGELKKSDHSIAYFFCKGMAPQRHRMLILQNILHSIATDHPKELSKAFHDHLNSTHGSLTFELYWETLKTMMREVDFDITYVFDGLDDLIVRGSRNSFHGCGEDKLLIAFLQLLLTELHTNKHHNVGRFKILLTSQRSPEIAEATELFPECVLDLDLPALRADVTKMIEKDVKAISEQRSLPKKVRDVIQREIASKAGENFRYARLAIQLLKEKTATNASSLSYYKHSLSSLQVTDFDAQYEDHLHFLRTKGGSEDDAQNRIGQMLRILAFALGDLSIEDLQHAMAWNKPPVDMKQFETRLPNGLSHVVEAYCGPFLLIEDNKVRFTHQSVKTFLQQLKSSLWPEFSCESKSQGNQLLATTCITCICDWQILAQDSSYRQYAAPWNENSTLMPFLAYASTYWTNHLKDVGGKYLHVEACAMLQDPKKFSAMTWATQVAYVKETVPYKDWIPPPMGVFLASANLSELMLKEPETLTKSQPTKYSLPDSVRLSLERQFSSIIPKESLELDKADADGFTALHFAAKNGNKKLIDFLIAQGLQGDLLTLDGRTPFSLAVASGGESTALHFINIRQCFREESDPKRLSALQWVITRRMKTVLQRIIHGKWPINEGGFMKWTPLYITCQYDYYDLFQILLDNGADPSIKTSDGTIALHAAAREGHVHLIHQLFSRYPDLDHSPKSDEEFTPLHYAASHGHLEVIHFLLRQGAKASPDKRGNLPLHYAAAQGYLKIVSLLASPTYNVAQNKNAFLPLHMAAEHGHTDIVDFFLKVGVDPNAKGLDPMAASDASDELALTRNVLKCALKSKREDCIQLLLRQPDIEVDQCSAKGASTLEMALYHEQSVSICAELVKHGLDPLHATKTGWDSLLYASRYGSAEVLEWLLQEVKARPDFDINRTNDNGMTAVYMAVLSGSVAKYELLLKAGADVHKSTTKGFSPYSVACALPDPKMLKHMMKSSIDFQADMVKRTVVGSNLLTIATEGSDKTFKLLPFEKLEIDAANCFMERPLFWAFYRNHVGVCQMLMEKGANPTLRNQMGLSVLDYVHKEHALWPVFKPYLSSYEPLSIQARRQKIRTAYIEILEHPVTGPELYEEPSTLYFLDLAVLFLRYGEREADVRIALETRLEFFRTGSSSFSRGCVNCRLILSLESWYVCRDCFIHTLCKTCFEEREGKGKQPEGCAKSHTYIEFGGKEWKSLKRGTVDEQGRTITQWLDSIRAEFSEDAGGLEDTKDTSAGQEINLMD